MALHGPVVNGDTVIPAFFNDFRDLFTGVMQDQPITFRTNETLQAIGGPPAAPAVVASAGTGLGIGVYKYAVTFVTADGGETLAGTQATITTTSGNQQGSLSAIPTGPTGATKRNIYRTAVGGSTLFLAATLNDNTTTTYIDSLADATLTTHAQAPAHPSFGGSLIIKDQNGTVQFQIFSDGSMSTGAGGLTVGNTTISGTLTVTGAATLQSTLGVTGDATLGGLVNVGAAVGGTFGNIRYAGVNNSLQFMSPQSGATPLGHLFVTWNGSAQKIPFSVGGQFAGALAYVDNAGVMHTAGALQSTSGFIGFKNSSGTKLAEFNSSGQLVVSAGNPSFVTTAATDGFANNATFDTFDVCEAYECDAAYAPGTVVCPFPDGMFTRCTHDGCHAAMVVSRGGGMAFGMGAFTDEETGEPKPLNPNLRPLSLVGRVLVRCEDATTAFSNGQATLLTANGNGGVRAMRPGESGFSLGYALMDARENEIGLVVRPLYCVAPAVEAPATFGQAKWGEATWGKVGEEVVGEDTCSKA